MSDNNINEEKVEQLEKEELVQSELAKEASEKPYQDVIEDARNNLYKSFMLSRRISNIVMFAVVIAIVGIMFLIISNKQVLKIIGYSLAGALVVGMIVYYLINRKKFPNKTKEYVLLVSNALNDRAFSKPGYSEIKYDPDERMKLDDIIGDGVYEEANGVNSRNVIHGVFNGHHFLYAEAALTRPSTRKQQVPPLFVGHYISVPNQLKFEGRFVFVNKNPKEPLDLPNAINDLVVLEEKDDFMVYGPEGANYHQTIDNKIISKIRNIELGGHLLNVNVVFWEGHTAAYLSYDDTIMSVPFDKPFDYQGFEKAFDDLHACLEAITEE